MHKKYQFSGRLDLFFF